jgi:hypothetical protein
MTTRTLVNVEVGIALIAILLLAIAGYGQEVAMSELKFNAGQSVQPAYEGWTRNADGSRSMWFGYMNRTGGDTDIQIDRTTALVPKAKIRPADALSATQQAFVFKVNVPADWPADKDPV